MHQKSWVVELKGSLMTLELVVVIEQQMTLNLRVLVFLQLHRSEEVNLEQVLKEKRPLVGNHAWVVYSRENS